MASWLPGFLGVSGLLGCRGSGFRGEVFRG